MSEATTTAPSATGTVCWNELLSTDASGVRDFYTKLFGYEVEEKDMGPMGTYTLFTKGDKQIGGMMQNPEPGGSSIWVPYIAVEDVDASTKQAESFGAKVCVPPSDIPQIGRFSMISDPAGATLGLFKGTHTC